MDELREKIAKQSYYQNAGESRSDPELVAWEYLDELCRAFWYENADQILTLFQGWLKKEVEKLEVIGDEEILDGGWFTHSHIAKWGAKAQLDKDKSLLDKIERMME